VHTERFGKVYCNSFQAANNICYESKNFVIFIVINIIINIFIIININIEIVIIIKIIIYTLQDTLLSRDVTK